jgi:hypothetical protein
VETVPALRVIEPDVAVIDACPLFAAEIAAPIATEVPESEMLVPVPVVDTVWDTVIDPDPVTLMRPAEVETVCPAYPSWALLAQLR